MNFDFSLLLFCLTVISGLLWVADITYFAPRRKAHGIKIAFFMFDYARSLFPVFLFVFMVRSFAFEPFRIPSASMMPTLLIGDFILVRKYDYGIRLPIINKKIIDFSEPERGDVVVFRYPSNPKIHYIKRIIGLPGDTITYKNKTVYINGMIIPQIMKNPYQAIGSGKRMQGLALKEERLDDQGYNILIDPNRNSNTRTYQVPSGYYFVLGDNRDYSVDSRAWGFVPDENLLGRATLIWMNWDIKVDEFDFSRAGTTIR